MGKSIKYTHLESKRIYTYREKERENPSKFKIKMLTEALSKLISVCS